MIKSLAFSFLFGILFGAIFSKVILFLFPSLTIEIKTSIPFLAMIGIFFKNSFLVTLICFGGVIFSFTELKVYRFSKIYRILDKLFDPFYSFLKFFSKDYRKLGPMYRSCYFSLFYFPLVCVFLFSFLISLYFSTFLFLFGTFGIITLQKLLPHVFLESFVFVSSAFIALKIADKLKAFILQKKMNRFEREAKKFLLDKKVWIRLFILYVVLLFSAFVEKLFVEL